MTSSERSPAQGNNETVARHHGARDNDNRHVLGLHEASMKPWPNTTEDLSTRRDVIGKLR
jgi:hypothetical protein